MITDNNKRTRVCSLGLAMILLFSPLFVGCNVGTDSAFDAVGEMLGTVGTESVLECEVVYPEGCSAAVVMASRELAELLEEQTEMYVTAHQYDKKYDPEKLYVVIGRVSDDVTEYWYDGMREDDYVCRAYKNTVAIGGITDGTTLTAIQRFMDEILPAAEYGYIAEEGFLFEFVGTYDDDENENEKADKVLLNGCGLGEYDIVCMDGSLISLAEALGEGIDIKTGYPLGVFLRDPSDSKREIIVRVNNELGAMKYRIYGYGDDIFVESDSVYGVSLAIDGFLERIPEVTGDEVKELQIVGEECFSYVNYGITVASYRIGKNIGMEKSELVAVASAVKQSGADVITVEIPNRNIWNAINMQFYNDYDIRLLDCDDGGLVAVLSRPNMTAVDSAVLTTEQGVVATEITATCLGKRYRALSLYLPEEGGAEMDLARVDTFFEQTEESSVCIIMTAKNYVVSKDFVNTDSYLCATDGIVNSGTAKYKISALISPSLDCYDNGSVLDNEGRFIGAVVSVRDGIK